MIAYAYRYELAFDDVLPQPCALAAGTLVCVGQEKVSVSLFAVKPHCPTLKLRSLAIAISLLKIYVLSL